MARKLAQSRSMPIWTMTRRTPLGFNSSLTNLLISLIDRPMRLTSDTIRVSPFFSIGSTIFPRFLSLYVTPPLTPSSLTSCVAVMLWSFSHSLTVLSCCSRVCFSVDTRLYMITFGFFSSSSFAFFSRMEISCLTLHSLSLLQTTLPPITL